MFRTLQKTRALVRSALTSCFKTDSPDLDRIIGIPIRGSDKCYRNGTRDGKPIRFGEANCVTLADTMQYATLVHSAQPWVDTVMITSEDESAIANSRFQLGSDRQKTWKTLFNDFDVHQGTGRSSAVYGKKSPDSSEKYIPAYVITQSILTTLACQALPSHHIVMMRSSTSDRSLTEPNALFGFRTCVYTDCKRCETCVNFALSTILQTLVV